MLHDELLHKWINKTISDEELAEFKKRPEYDSLVELYQQTDGLKVEGFNEDHVLQNILREEKKSSNQRAEEGLVKQTRVIPLWIKLAVAASFVLAAALFFLPANSVMNYQTGQGEAVSITLPDNSRVRLNPGSTLSYDKSAYETQRLLDFSGDAFFEVEKGNQFIVNTNQGQVEVLGTSFNVNTLNMQLDVLCKSGRVAVRSRDNSIEEILEADESLKIKNNQLSLSSKKDMVRFKDMPFFQVIELFQKHYKKRIEPKGIDISTRVNGYFVRDDMEAAIKSISLPMELSYQIDEDETIVLSK